MARLPQAGSGVLLLALLSSCATSSAGPDSSSGAPRHIPPPPEPPPPPSAPSNPLVDVQVCVVQNGQLRHVEAQYNEDTGDTVGIAALRPDAEGYAGVASWFVTNAPLTFAHRSYVKYGLPRVLNIGDITRVGAYQGVPVFAEPGVGAHPEVLYIPVQPGCEFQPYQIGPELNPAVVLAHRRPERAVRPVERHTAAGSASGPAMGWAAAIKGRQLVPAAASVQGEIYLGGIETRLPKRFREGRPRLVTITLLAAAPGESTVQIVVDTIRGDGEGTQPIETDTTVIKTDSTTLAPNMGVRLSADSANGAAFVIDTLSPYKQHIYDRIPARWNFRVTPLRAGKQRLYIVMNLLVESDTTQLKPIIKPIDVEVDRVWRTKHWFRVNVAPIAVTTVLSILGFFGKWLFDKRKSSNDD